MDNGGQNSIRTKRTAVRFNIDIDACKENHRKGCEEDRKEESAGPV